MRKVISPACSFTSSKCDDMLFIEFNSIKSLGQPQIWCSKIKHTYALVIIEISCSKWDWALSTKLSYTFWDDTYFCKIELQGPVYKQWIWLLQLKFPSSWFTHCTAWFIYSACVRSTGFIIQSQWHSAGLTMVWPPMVSVMETPSG